MTAFLGETEIKESPETLAEVLTRMDERQAGDAVTLKKIERNTSLLQGLLKGARLSLKRQHEAAASPVRRAFSERPRDERGRFAVRETVAMARRERTMGPRSATPSVATAQSPVTATPVPVAPASAAPAAAGSAQVQASAVRDRRGRFQGIPRPTPPAPENNPQTLAGILAKALKGSVSDKKGDLKDAVGRSVMGGAGWEAAQQAMEAFSSAKEGMNKQEGTVHDLKQWGKGKLQALRGPNATPTERTEQRRHWELLEAVREIRPGDGDGGMDDAIGGALGGAAGTGLFKKVLSKIPGVTMAQRVLTTLASGAGLAALTTVGTLAAGFGFIKSLIDRGGENGWHDPLTKDQSRAIDPNQTKGPSEADKKRWRDAFEKSGNVVDAGPGFTVTKDAQGNIVKRSGDRAWRNNNPGNLEYGPFAKRQGAAGSDGRFAVFPDYRTGRQAMAKKLFESKDYAGKNLTDVIAAYAPRGENNTARYQKRVLSAVGANKPMSQYTPQEREKILSAMESVEGNRKGRTDVVTPPAKMTPPATVQPVKPQAPQAAKPVEPLKERPPAPVTATVPGMDALVSAASEKRSPRSSEKPQGQKITMEFPDTYAYLLSHDRV